MPEAGGVVRWFDFDSQLTEQPTEPPTEPPSTMFELDLRAMKIL